MDPTLVVGGLVQNLNTNSLLGQSDFIVVEADEYDKSFLQMKPTFPLVVIAILFFSHLTHSQNTLDEINNSGINKDKLWKLWHGDSHLIADDKLEWKKKRASVLNLCSMTLTPEFLPSTNH